MRPGQVEPNEFEVAILEHIASREPFLRDAISRLHVLSREFTGVGSFTNFRVDESDPDVAQRVIEFVPSIRMPGLQYGMGALLFCRGHQPKCLETYAFDERWDGVYTGFSIDEDT